MALGEKLNQALPRLAELAENNNKIPNYLHLKYNTKRGLRDSNGAGVLVGLTEIGDVHGFILDEGEKIPDYGRLLYRGINVNDIVEGFQKEGRFGFEEVCYLLLLGQLPNAEELEGFNHYLGETRLLPGNFIEDMIINSPSPDIMNKMARNVLSLYTFDPNPDDISVSNLLRQSFELIARLPIISAYAYQAKVHYYDKKSLIIHLPEKNLSTAENLLYMIRPDNQYSKLEAEILDLALVLHAEHGGGNNSTFTIHVVTSSDTDTYSAISAGIGSLKGPKHGGANIKVSQMMSDLKQNVKDKTDKTQLEEYLVKLLKREAFDGAGLIYGFGHAVYTLSDPRAILLKDKAKELAYKNGMGEEFEMYSLIEELVPSVFADVKKTSQPISPNVDFYSGLVYSMLNIPTELYTPIFAIARVAGWAAHRIEEVVSGGKIIRPAYKSVVAKRPYIPITERQPSH